MGYNLWEKYVLASTTLSFLFLSYALSAIAKAPTTGYEISIYSATPLIFWVTIIIGIFNGISIIVLGLYDKIKTTKIIAIGAFEIIFCHFLLLTLYILRGYVYLERADTLSYIGYAKDISMHGYFFSYNYYPIIPILLSQLNQIANISTLALSGYLPALFFAFYILSIYCLSKSLTVGKKFIFSSLIASTPLFFAWFSPTILLMSLATLTLPLFFYCFQRSSDPRFKFFCIILCIIYTFFHPVIAVMIFVYLVVLFVSEKVRPTSNKKISIALPLISFIFLAVWFTSQYLLLRRIKSILLALLGSSKISTPIAQSLYFYHRLGTIAPFVLMDCDEMIFYALSLIVIYYILFKYKRALGKNFVPISSCFVIGSLFIIGISISTNIYAPYRIINLNPNMVLTPILVGFLLYLFLVNKKKAKVILVLILILISTVTSILSLYQSPITELPTDQVSVSEVTGMTWLISLKSQKLRTADIKTPVFRYADLIYGYNFKYGRNLSRDLIIPNHFGFSNDSIFPIDKSRYLVITAYDIKAYTEVWKNQHIFEKEDFAKINLCRNSNRVYENGEFQTYLVYKS